MTVIRLPCRREEGGMSFETRKQDAEKVLRRWRRSNQSSAAQKRLINDGERAWMLAGTWPARWTTC